MVDHVTLLKKLFIYGVTRRSLQWFNWYLKDGKQKVMIQRRLSSPQSITAGVPQGSILGPLLSILFVNDLPLDVSKSHVKIYADDTTQVAFGRTVKEVETILTHELRLLSRWADENKMVLNHSKTKSMIVCSKPKFRGLDGENLKVRNDKSQLDFLVRESKQLGIKLDNCLKKLEILLSAHARTSQADILNLDKKAAKCTTCKLVCGKF